MTEEPKNNQPVVYVPDGAKLNFDGKPMKEPTVEYERRKVRFDIDGTKRIASGIYGRTARYKRP